MSKKLDSIQQKKKELESSLSKIQNNLDRSLEEVKDDMSENLSPRVLVEKYPLQIVGLSVLAGFLIGSSGKSGKQGTVNSKNVLLESVGYSLRKRITKKIVETALDFIENQLSDKGGKEA